MAQFMFDTNMCIYLIKNQPEQVARRFEQCYVGDVVMSAITYAELEYGVALSQSGGHDRRNLAQLVEKIPVMPFDVLAALAYGPIRKATRERNRDHLDKLIAAHAVALDVTLVTNNERDFTAYPALKIENWLTHP